MGFRRIIISDTGFPLNTATIDSLTAELNWQDNLISTMIEDRIGDNLIESATEGYAIIAGFKVFTFSNGNISLTNGFINYRGTIYSCEPLFGFDPNAPSNIRLCLVRRTSSERLYNNVQGNILPVETQTSFRWMDPATILPGETIINQQSQSITQPLTYEQFLTIPKIKSLLELSQFSMPDGVVVDPNYLAFTQAMLDKLNGIQAGAQVNVKPSWTAAAGSANEILNKPDILDVLTRGTVNIGDIGNASYPVIFIGYTAPTTNYAVYVSFETVSGSTALNSATYYYVVHSKTTTGFQITMRETGNGTQALILNYMIVRNLN